MNCKCTSITRRFRSVSDGTPVFKIGEIYPFKIENESKYSHLVKPRYPHTLASEFYAFEESEFNESFEVIETL